MHDVADKVGELGTIGAIAAAVAAFALSCRMRGPKLVARPPAFPRDGNAELKKYENAFLQLNAQSAQMEIGERTSYDTASEYALRAYEIAQGLGIKASQALKVSNSKPVQMDIQKPSKSTLPRPPKSDIAKNTTKTDPKKKKGEK